MISRSTITALKFGSVAFLLVVLLFADGTLNSANGFVGSISKEVAAVGQNAATQWMLVLGLAGYFAMLLILKSGDSPRGNIWRLNNANLWLVAFILAALLRYALTYTTAVGFMQMPALMIGIVFGKAISTWARWQDDLLAEPRTVWLIRLLVCLLAGSALWHPEAATAFSYRGLPRWSGVWINPNLYGLLMGTGLVLAVGIGIRELRLAAGGRQKFIRSGWCFFAAILTGYGLFKSYSRGAWLAVFAGLICLAFQAIRSSRFSAWFGRNWFSLAVLTASLWLLGFWQFRFSESRPAQRMFSVGNLDDFSWRNRVTAWEGAVRMMADQPLAGFGWGQAETDYGKKYCSSRLDNGAAIEMNDYLMIGISAGVPALLCFAAYLALSVRKKSTGSDPAFSIFTVCRSGCIVLLVGFWFDGGLFKVPVAIVFWMLLELARIETFAENEVTSLTSIIGNRSGSSHVAASSTGEIWLRRAAWVFAAIALIQSAVYLGTPFLPVGDGTLAVARKCLIQRSEAEDFDYLSTNTIWRGKKLKILLEHVRLAHYNRQLINWQLDDKIYDDLVLSPIITGNSSESLNWRRLLWEEFYPRIRHESSPAAAAQVIVRQLRERVTITALPNSPHDVPDIWLKQTTDETGFEIICIATLRSIGIPARLDSNGHAEFWDENKWQTACDSEFVTAESSL